MSSSDWKLIALIFISLVAGYIIGNLLPVERKTDIISVESRDTIYFKETFYRDTILIQTKKIIEKQFQTDTTFINIIPDDSLLPVLVRRTGELFRTDDSL